MRVESYLLLPALRLVTSAAFAAASSVAGGTRQGEPGFSISSIVRLSTGRMFGISGKLLVALGEHIILRNNSLSSSLMGNESGIRTITGLSGFVL